MQSLRLKLLCTGLIASARVTGMIVFNVHVTPVGVF
jgi:hypothetical protein